MLIVLYDIDREEEVIAYKADIVPRIGETVSYPQKKVECRVVAVNHWLRPLFTPTGYKDYCEQVILGVRMAEGNWYGRKDKPTGD